MTDNRLAELEALAKAATPGPWFAVRLRVNTCVKAANGDYVMEAGARGRALVRHEEDADFIAATDPETVLALIAELLRLRAELKRVAPLLAMRGAAGYSFGPFKPTEANP